MLMVEGDDVAAGCEFENCLRVEVGSDPGVAHHLGRGVIGALGKDPEPNTKCGGSLCGHTRELTAADHADNRRFLLRHLVSLSAAHSSRSRTTSLGRLSG